ncbi:hypothetical protein CCM_02708 [Cordyceps militaris CM01]|uniref:Uncharacterized protein n=1 Tax=Cordyceps militaris (strain CM01) TaxID=983644 RepID=G3JB77_CORMM|nr:uncharacterized protein CCM_02708 [Cordyceps militaris CM01]EGX94437.1 hypothetical protein CCM_02708 [Cordyceps militaris CM01]
MKAKICKVDSLFSCCCLGLLRGVCSIGPWLPTISQDSVMDMMEVPPTQAHRDPAKAIPERWIMRAESVPQTLVAVLWPLAHMRHIDCAACVTMRVTALRELDAVSDKPIRLLAMALMLYADIISQQRLDGMAEPLDLVVGPQVGTCNLRADPTELLMHHHALARGRGGPTLEGTLRNIFHCYAGLCLHVVLAAWVGSDAVAAGACILAVGHAGGT